MVEVVKRTAGEITIPFTVGGGISHVDDMKRLLRAGADKIGINTAAVQKPYVSSGWRAEVRIAMYRCGD